jgi:hypothetical protein
LVQPVANTDLVAFLQALPEGRKRRGVRYPQWLLLLMAILGILRCLQKNPVAEGVFLGQKLISG